MNYYKVLAKCGHVGKNCYMLNSFYVIAENGREAAALARTLPRVKHDHKDAIRDVELIDFEEYKRGQTEQSSDPYNHCRNRQEQNRYAEQLESRILPEEDISYRKEKPRQNAKKALRYGHGSGKNRFSLYGDEFCA